MTAVAQGWKVPDTAGWIVKGRGDHFISLYPVVVPVIIAPLYLPVISYLNWTDWDPLRLDRVARIMEKLCASLLATASVVLLYLLLRRRTDPKAAALLTLVFAFGTTTWVISSQALWMHGLAELSVAATLLLLTGPCSALRAVAAGFFCALVACNRQPDAVLAAGLGLYGLWWAGRRVPLFLAAGALLVGLVLTYNLGVVGHVAGAYALRYKPDFVRGDVLANVAGLLFSPTHGLFVFSPFLLFVPCCLPLVLRDRSTRGLTAAIGGAVILQLIVYGIFVDWRQGVSFGPRWLTDMLPMLFWMLPPVVAALSAAGRVAFGSACGVAIAIEVVGAFWYTGVSDAAVLAARGPDKMRAAWDIRNASFIAELRHPPAPADLAVNLRGHIDLVTVRDKGGDKAERQVEIQGWTLTGSRSPAAVHVTVDGRLIAGTGEFFERPDVVRALGEPSRSGWQITLPAHDLAAGEHVIAVLVQAYEGSEARLLQERTFTAPADLVVDLRGHIDLVTVRDKEGDRAERQVEIQGWALTGSRSPATVYVTVDGRLMAETAEFFERPDVVRALGEPSRSAWQVTFPAHNLAPGEHVVAVLVRAYEGSEPRLLQERTFTLTADNEADRRDRELANAARLAAKVLAERQQSSGYWLTRFTDTARFEHPRQEMNTFVNAVMIDVAAPVAERAGLAGALGRARDFLANQIEAGGLVRYHGHPDAPTIGSLGCAITPDADDTALVWRVAPGERSELLATALATLSRFRTADGLYRTWLAPHDRYECIDPGKDPNPADIAIQIHVLMLLAQADPPAARALCEALQKRSGDEDLWVYYKMAPPIVILRLMDLRKAGCPLQLPQARLQTIVPGQEVWIEATQLLQRMDSAQGSYAAYARAAELLHKLAGDEFSLLARTPPLLYHNDLTASVRRFYWSEELGYTLWLRLYFANERARARLLCRGSDAKQGCVEP